MTFINVNMLITVVIPAAFAGGLIAWIVSFFFAPAAARKQASAMVEAAREQAKATVTSAQRQAIETERLKLRCEVTQRRLKEFDCLAAEFMSELENANPEATRVLSLKIALSAAASLVADPTDDLEVSRYVVRFDEICNQLVEALLGADTEQSPKPGESRPWSEAIASLQMLRHVVDWAAERRLEKAVLQVPDAVPRQAKAISDILPDAR